MNGEQIVTLKLKIRIYEEEIAPMSLEVFLYRLINQLNNEHDILEVEIDGKKKVMKNDKDVKDLPLREGKDL